MKFVRSVPRGSTDGPFHLEEDKFIPLSDIQKIIVRNVNPTEVQKDEGSYQLDDPDTCLQHYFTSNEDAEPFSLTSDEHFPPDQMFEVNKQKYNVTSSYRENLEGYTVPLDKTDPEFKAKEEYYAKVAKEIEDNKCLASAWESLADGEVENEELKFSAVLHDGVQGRELKNAFVRTTKRGGRGSNRASLPRDCSEVHKSTETKSQKSNSAPLRDQNKSSTDSTASKASSDVALEKGSPKPASHESPVTADASANAVSSPAKDLSKPVEAVGKKEDKKRGFLDPDAPEFKPSGFIVPLEPASLAGAAFNPVAYSQPLPLSVSGFAASSQHSLPNGGAPAVQFNLPSSVSCVLPSTVGPQFTALRHPQIGFSPQQLAMVSQQLSASGSLSNQPNVVQSAAGSRGPRQGVPAGNYSKQRSIDQANTASQQLSFPIFSPQGFSFVQSASYPIGVPLLSTVAGNFQSTAYAGMHALTGAVSASQASGQQSSTSHSSQPSSGQAQGTQFHPGYNAHLGGVQCPAGVAAYPQYSTAQLIGSQAPGSLGYYSQPVYQAPGMIPFSIQQVGASGQPQIGSQLHNQGQQSLIPSQPLQLQAAQQQGTVQSVQQQPQPHVFFTAGPYHLSPQQVLAQAMTMGVPHQAVPNTFSIPQSVHPQPHPVQLYMPQQPNSTG
ncbi:Ataxin-2-like protein [Taenia crassiceps]|uniref:Ataxin-2-like protein n=1 Tax=Taenia crassiceps TaxID=6207 RepID=A0ABR4QRR1_9CEST